MGVVPAEWMPKCEMERIITHWTAGGYKASTLDRQHYHILIEGDGELVRGLHPISDNVHTGDGDYAAHTKGRNTRSIGISACCMAGAREKPFQAGKFPMTLVRWERMAEVAADLAKAYGIPVTPKTILAHGEVQAQIGPSQDGKWDPLALPWDPKLSKAKAGELFRARVRAALGGPAGLKTLAADGEGLLLATALLNGATVERAVFSNEDVLLSLTDLRAVPGLNLAPGTDKAVAFAVAGASHELAVGTLDLDDPAAAQEAWISAKELAAALDAKLSYDPDRNVVALAWA